MKIDWQRLGPALQHRNYRLFLTGQQVSLIGTWMQNMAQSWLVLNVSHGSAFALGLIGTLQFLPTTLLLIPAGMIVDRVPKRSLLLVTQSAAMLLAFVLAILATIHVVEVWHVYLLAFLLGISNAFDMPTRQAFVSEMVGRQNLANAVALNSSMFNAARVLGPAIAGALIGVFGVAVAFWLNGVSYLAVIACLAMMRPSEFQSLPAKSPASQSSNQLREGFDYIVHTPRLLMIVVLVAIVSTFGINFNIWVPMIARDLLHVGASGYGLLMASMGGGSLVTALAMSIRKGTPTRIAILVMTALFAILEMVLPLSRSLLVSSVVLALIGAAVVGITTATNTSVQMQSPDHLRGRVMSFYLFAFMGATPIGAFVAGILAHEGGLGFSMAVCGLISLAAVPVVFLMMRAEARSTPGALP